MGESAVFETAAERGSFDIEEGADMVMVKPAVPYLDVLGALRNAFDVPVAAYHVSGEYAMLKAAAANGWIDHDVVATEHLTAIKRAGAELCSLRNAEGLELLWQAGPAWPRHSPLLFPIVGRLKNDQLRHRGKTYPMTQHGFARDLRFSWLRREPNLCQLVLCDEPDTRSRYPFAFHLEVTYAVSGAELEVTLRIDNHGDEVLPASIGAHPAFNWPLLPGWAPTACLKSRCWA